MTPNNQNSLEFKVNPNKPKSGPRENRQRVFLHFRAQGESIIDACTLAGITRSCYEQWHVRYEGFPEAVEAARPRKPRPPQPVPRLHPRARQPSPAAQPPRLASRPKSR